MSTAKDQIKERLNILDVVGQYVKLTKAGKNYKAKSPFSNEKTPSFYVSPDRGMYYCFSTNKGGDIFTFISEMEGVDFKGALKILAERAGVELVPENPEARNEREQLYAILEDATRFFEANLRANKDEEKYLTDRGVSLVTIKSWRIGYALDDWRTLYTHLREKKYPDVLILKAGLIKDTEKGGAPYDVFRNRIMFPIADASGRPVGFSGRDRSGKEDTPKYVNSPETPLYEKSRILFGYDKARHGIRKHDFSLVVEGQFDLVLSHQAGYNNAVAISGTALTPHHLELLERLSPRIVFALDADRAGINSVKRGAALALMRGMDIKVADIVGGKDPADLVKEDPALLRKAVGSATHVIEYLTKVILRETHDERTFRLRVRDEVLPLVALIPNRVDAEHFEGIVATETKTTRDAIHFEVERIREKKQSEERQEASRVIFTQKETPPTVERPLLNRDEEIAKHIYGMVLWQKSEAEPRLDLVRLEKDLEHFGFPIAVMKGIEEKFIFEVEHQYGEKSTKEILEDISRLMQELAKNAYKKEHGILREALHKAEGDGDTVKRDSLLTQFNDIQKKLKEIESTNPFNYGVSVKET